MRMVDAVTLIIKQGRTKSNMEEILNSIHIMYTFINTVNHSLSSKLCPQRLCKRQHRKKKSKETKHWLNERVNKAHAL